MSKHTPGPWTAKKFGYEKWSVNGANGVEVCGAWHPGNARLIAAAPDLLEAAQLALSIAESWIHDTLDGTISLKPALQHLDPVRAAIAKARGEA